MIPYQYLELDHENPPTAVSIQTFVTLQCLDIVGTNSYRLIIVGTTLGCNFNDLPALPPCPSFGGVGGSRAVSGGAGGGSAASAIPMEQEGDSDSGNPNDFIV